MKPKSKVPPEIKMIAHRFPAKSDITGEIFLAYDWKHVVNGIEFNRYYDAEKYLNELKEKQKRKRHFMIEEFVDKFLTYFFRVYIGLAILMLLYFLYNTL